MLERGTSRTKILATLGPATASAARIRDLIRAGVDGFRINMSHGTPEDRARMITAVKRLRKKMKRPVAILVDLRGPRIRLGTLDEPRTLKKGEEIVLITGKKARNGALPVDYRRLPSDLKTGNRVLLRDGLAELKVLAIDGREVRCKVVRGAVVSSNQGVNLPDTEVKAPALSAQDRRDIQFAADQEVDWIAMSFVRSAADVKAVRRAIKRTGLAAPVMAKIERPEAVKLLDEILEESDAVMVARGDLAVEMGHETVPSVQKLVIRRGIETATPVIIATQMLESMIENSQPTRAEVSDVANAAYDGADAVMLSGETAVGRYPLQTARAMQKILIRTEAQTLSRTKGRRIPDPGLREGEMTVERATVNAAVMAARTAGARLILAFTESGRSARLVSSFRSSRTLVGLTGDERSFHRMALYWGVRPALMRRVDSVREMYREAAKTLTLASWLGPKDLVVGITGTFAISGATNTIRLLPLSRLSRAESAKLPR